MGNVVDAAGVNGHRGIRPAASTGLGMLGLAGLAPSCEGRRRGNSF